MHHTAYTIGGMAMDTYCPRDGAKILEVGSYAVNGALRDHASPGNEYIGLDIEAGPGVDVVAEPGRPFPLEDNQFDMILASSAFEHDDAFWVTFLEMCRKAKAGGHIYINVPSNGLVHRYPQDNWRFYPDSGLALAKWARSQDLDVILVESFVAERDRDTWNDYVAVFRKGPTSTELNTNFLYQRVACSNAITWQSDAINNRRDQPEDMILVTATTERATRLEENLAGKIIELQSATAKIADAESQITRLNDGERQLSERLAASEIVLAEKAEAFEALSRSLTEQARLVGELGAQIAASDQEISRLAEQAATFDARIADHTGVLDAKDAQIEALEAERSSLTNRLADSDSTLRQRREEIAQAWAELEAERAAKAALQTAFDTLQDHAKKQACKLEEEAGWTFKLAGERRQAEQRATLAEIALAKERTVFERQLAEARNVPTVLERAAPQTQDRSPQRLDRQFAQIASLVDQLRAREQEIAATVQPADALQSELAAIRQQQSTVNTDLASAHKQLRAAQLELAARSGALANEQRRAQQAVDRLDWLRTVNQVVSSRAKWWWVIMPPSWRRQRELHALQRRGLFDATAYLDRYPDVAAAGIDALQHFIAHGMLEGRRGNTGID